MKAIKIIVVLLLPVTLLACVSAHKPPMPSGKSVPINSTATNEMLAHHAGLVVVGPSRNDPVVSETLIHKAFNQEQKQFYRKSNRSSYARVSGGEIIERTVRIGFQFGSIKFRPSPEQHRHIQQLLAVADRAEVRGRTDGRGSSAVDHRIAKLRAEAAKRYLLSRGFPSDLIAVNYLSAGDYIADNESHKGRQLNRRVEIEFYIDDFTAVRHSNLSIAAQCEKPLDLSQWHEAGKPHNTGC